MSLSDEEVVDVDLDFLALLFLQVAAPFLRAKFRSLFCSVRSLAML